MYDTVKCSTEIWPPVQEIPSLNSFTVEDYNSSEIFYNIITPAGTYVSQLASYLDTAKVGGTSDWYLSTFQNENSVDCNSAYCKVTCVVYRNLITDDKDNDVQYAERAKLQVVGGFRVWDSRITKSDQAGFIQGKSSQMEIEYGGAIAQTLALATVVSTLVTLSLL